ncbi:hypothetical protein DFAR_810001 [Desulfarculales bacterium]
MGTSSNALGIQIWAALIALLLLKWLTFPGRMVSIQPNRHAAA